MIYLTLWPLSQGEILGRREHFIDRLFDGDFPAVSGAQRGRAAYAKQIVAGGYPEVFDSSPRTRSRFFASYVASILGRDLDAVGRVQNPQAITQLLRLLGGRSAQTTNFNAMAHELGLDQKTAKHYGDLLTQLYLAHQLPPWHTNLWSAPDQVAEDLRARYGPPRLPHRDQRGAAAQRRRRRSHGHVLRDVRRDGARAPEWADEEVSLYHYRDKAQREADLVLERNNGDVVAIEVKAAATVREDDFRGIAYLRDKLGSRFRAGAVLFAGDKTLPFGDRLAAVPITGLWEA